MHFRHSRHDLGLVLIGLFKLLKTTLLLVVGVGVLRLLHHDVAQTLTRWLEALRIDPQNHWVHAFVKRVLGVDQRTLEAVDVGAFVYAAVFATEGIGLLLEKRWAEYFTVFVTVSFIPFEVLELVHRTTWLRAGTLALNVFAVLYVIWRLARPRPVRTRGALST